MAIARILAGPKTTMANQQQAADDVMADARTRLLTRERLLWACALSIFAALLFVASDLLFHVPILRPSSTPYYLYQASSWLQGRWDIWPVPLPKPDLIFGGLHYRIDLVVLDGRFYNVYGSFPAVLALPFVAIFG